MKENCHGTHAHKSSLESRKPQHPGIYSIETKKCTFLCISQKYQTSVDSSKHTGKGNTERQYSGGITSIAYLFGCAEGGCDAGGCDIGWDGLELP